VTPDQEARFWGKVVVVENCWEWAGTVVNGGYPGGLHVVNPRRHLRPLARAPVNRPGARFRSR